MSSPLRRIALDPSPILEPALPFGAAPAPSSCAVNAVAGCSEFLAFEHDACTEVRPVIARLQQRLEDIRQGEMRRARNHLSKLTPVQQAQVEELTASLVRRILQSSQSVLAASVGKPADRELIRNFRRLFGLEDDSEDARRHAPPGFRERGGCA